MPLTNLAEQSTATAYGYGTISVGYFARASARVRAYATSRGYSVDAATYTVKVRGPIALLPNRPVRSITSVTSVEDTNNTFTLSSDEWILRAGGTLETVYGDSLQVVYAGGLTDLPDGLEELVCAIASRMANTVAAAGSGVQQETGGSESVTYGFDSYTGISDLTKGELASLARFFPVVSSPVVLRAGSELRGPSQTRFSSR